MANKARVNEINGPSITAKNAVSTNNIFFCNNIDCSARMYLCKEGTDSPYFSSYSRSEHIYDFCLDGNLSFNPDSVSEKKFNLDNIIQKICKEANNDIHNKIYTKKGLGEVGSGKEISINTAKGLYAMCEYVGCGNSYNGVEINSIYLCQENRKYYKSALDGFCVVKAKYRKKVFGEPVIQFSFQTPYKQISLAVIFQNEESAWKFYNRIKKRANFKKLTYVIESVWEKDESGTYDYICHINKQSQIFYLMSE